MSFGTKSLVKYSRGEKSVKVCTFCEVENAISRHSCFVCGKDLTNAYISNDYNDNKPISPPPSPKSAPPYGSSAPSYSSAGAIVGIIIAILLVIAVIAIVIGTNALHTDKGITDIAEIKHSEAYSEPLIEEAHSDSFSTAYVHDLQITQR